jgi:hypothetical protein
MKYQPHDYQQYATDTEDGSVALIHDRKLDALEDLIAAVKAQIPTKLKRRAG